MDTEEKLPHGNPPNVGSGLSHSPIESHAAAIRKQRCYRPSYALVYAAMIPIIQEIGRKHGYAVAVHGSMATDFDIVACPWTEEATDAETLVEAIREHFKCVFFVDVQQQPDSRPHGRLAWSMHVQPQDGGIGGPYIDISVMPRLLP